MATHTRTGLLERVSLRRMCNMHARNIYYPTVCTIPFANTNFSCVCLQGLADGTRDRITVRPQAMLEAADLPTNHLSTLLEQKVVNALAADRQARAAMQVCKMVVDCGGRQTEGFCTCV